VRRSLLAAAVVFALPVAAYAQDASVLSGWDDFEFAKALAAYGEPEFAERVLFFMERSSEFTDQSRGPVTAIRLEIAQDRATRIEDPLDRRNALLQILASKEKFADDYEGSDAADDMRSAMPELYLLVGDAITEVVRKEKDEKAAEALRTEGDALFAKAELALKDRIASLKAIENPTEADEGRLMAASYNRPRTMYVHALLFATGSARRVALCKAALTEYDEFDLDYGGGDSLLPYYSYVDMGLCMKELDRRDDAIKSFDKTISLRESWGEKDERGVWPVPPEASDISDLVCWAVLQKLIVLREQDKRADVVAVGRDWLRSTARPFGPRSSMVLARELGDAQVATGDAAGAAATAESMVREDPNGWGAWAGRELLGRTSK
jgi:tetratricopeptide (TPR) repeat protein